MARKRELEDYFELQEGVEMQKSAHPLESLLQFIQGGTFDPNQQAQPGELPSRYLDKAAHVILPDFIKNRLPWMNPPSPQVEGVPQYRHGGAIQKTPLNNRVKTILQEHVNKLTS